MSDVYVLASPSPTLYVYPSALHPTPVTPPPAGGGPVFTQTRRPRVMRDRGSLRYRVTATATAQARGHGTLAYAAAWTIRPAPFRAAAALAWRVTHAGRVALTRSYTLGRALRPQPMRASAQHTLNVRTSGVALDHRQHPALSPVMFDLVFESWDD